MRVPVNKRRKLETTLLLSLASLLLPIVTLSFASTAAAQDLTNLAVQQNYTQERITSSDPTGGNDDGDRAHPIKPGETRTLASVAGPGIITHIWFTIDSPEAYHLKKLVLRIYWDDDPLPAVETPIGDFFGLGLGKYITYESAPLSVGSQKALNSFFVMPFRKKARITLTNDGVMPTGAVYYNIDWQKHASLPPDMLYFYAEYRQAQPNKGWTDDWPRNGVPKVLDKKNLTGEGNYTIVDTEGPGQYAGVTLSLLQNQGDWWGEGDEMMFIDGPDKPTITGTGSEDYFLGAWCYGNCGINPFGSTRPTFAYQRYGNPVNGGDDRGAGWTVYRFHIDSPVPFKKSFKMTIEHGHANARSDNFYTVAFWYQKNPHKNRPPLPPVEDRIPQLINTGGPTMGHP